MRKLLSIILAVVMLAGMMTVAIPASAEVVGKYDTFTAQYESGATEIYIEDEADFIAFENFLFAQTAATNTAGKTFYLVNDIYLNKGWTVPADLTAAVVAPVEADVENYAVFAPAALFYFGGTFDGQGHVISGFYTDTTVGSTASMFGAAAANATVKNIKVVNSYFGSTGSGVATLFSTSAKSARGILVENVYSDAALKFTGTKGHMGGLIAYANNACVTIKNTVFAGKIYNAVVNEHYIGGIFGYTNQSGIYTLENCGFFGDITVKEDVDNSLKKTQVGKLLGRFHANAGSGTIKDGDGKTVMELNLINCIAGGTGSYDDYRLSSGALIGSDVYVNASKIDFNITNTIWLNMKGMNPFTQLYSSAKHPALPEDGSETDLPEDNYTVFTNSCGVDKIALTGTVPANTVYTVGKAVPGNNWETPAEGATNVGSRTYAVSGAWDLTSTWTETPVGPLPTALLGSGEGTAFDGAVAYLGYQVKAVEGGYAIRFIGEGAFDEDIANVGLRVGVEGGNLAGLVSKAATTTKVYGGLVVGAEGGEDDYVAADGEFVYTINVGTFTADMGVITVHVTTLVDGGEGAIACQVKTVTIDTAKLPELAG